jgi:hypothetical protein
VAILNVVVASGMIGGDVERFHARTARLRLPDRVRDGVEGSPVTVVVDEKSPACTLTLHVRNLPLFDYREALRPSTRLGPPGEEEFEEEG